jgi:hypothetical protein
MYNRQILADHFNGKRAADDPEVQREFQLLKEQAELDWKAMYAGADARETPESIAKDARAGVDLRLQGGPAVEGMAAAENEVAPARRGMQSFQRGRRQRQYQRPAVLCPRTWIAYECATTL